ncbi:unnamed protein product [Rangifer tarandus platyrhynchus]|uniref:Uncharacterized protein n=1 Tax=Rangifer tarandus platyrhynchus TaxID=3082113 RepID=A0ABN8ZU24_RANTA|nr:unnamed protein product [Rangifer tarandus platyrhynchus]
METNTSRLDSRVEVDLQLSHPSTETQLSPHSLFLSTTFLPFLSFLSPSFLLQPQASQQYLMHLALFSQLSAVDRYCTDYITGFLHSLASSVSDLETGAPVEDGVQMGKRSSCGEDGDTARAPGVGRGGGGGGPERGREPAEERSARPARRRPLGEGERREGRTAGPASRPGSPRGPARSPTTGVPGALAAATSSRSLQGPTGSPGPVRAPAPGRSPATAASRPLPRAGGRGRAAPCSPRPSPPPRSPLRCRARLSLAALTREAAARGGGGGGLRAAGPALAPPSGSWSPAEAGGDGSVRRQRRGPGTVRRRVAAARSGSGEEQGWGAGAAALPRRRAPVPRPRRGTSLPPRLGRAPVDPSAPCSAAARPARELGDRLPGAAWGLASLIHSFAAAVARTCSAPRNGGTRGSRE